MSFSRLLSRAGCVLLAAAFAQRAAATSVDDVIVRQMWPWSRAVAVEFTAHDGAGDGSEQVTLSLFSGSSALGTVPGDAYTTDRVLSWKGKKHVEFDPLRVPALAGRGRVENLRVEVSVEPVPAGEVLYRIFDLRKTAGEAGSQVCVTEEALTNGVWGAWTPHYWPAVTAVKTPVWLAVTNDVKYRTTHLVMRRIPAGTFQMGRAPTEDVEHYRDLVPPVQVTLTKDYYIGVFPVTVCQQRVLRDVFVNDGEKDSWPDLGTPFNAFRGTDDWPTVRTVAADSHIGRLRARTGLPFDLPTEAQWEKAARAGSGGVYYDGTPQTHMMERCALAWCANNTPDGQRQPVGRLKPNNYGLYDTLGNMAEAVLDWQGGAEAEPEGDDPVGPAAAGASWTRKRITKGGAYNTTWQRMTLHARGELDVSTSNQQHSWRICLNLE